MQVHELTGMMALQQRMHFQEQGKAVHAIPENPHTFAKAEWPMENSMKPTTAVYSRHVHTFRSLLFRPTGHEIHDRTKCSKTC